MNDVVAILIGYDHPQMDDEGNERPTETRRTVYAKRRSITQREFYEAGQHRLNPSFSLVMFQHDYQGESDVEVDGERYSIYRTYVPEGRHKGFYAVSEQIELFCEKRIADA